MFVTFCKCYAHSVFTVLIHYSSSIRWCVTVHILYICMAPVCNRNAFLHKFIVYFLSIFFVSKQHKTSIFPFKIDFSIFICRKYTKGQNKHVWLQLKYYRSFPWDKKVNLVCKFEKYVQKSSKLKVTGSRLKAYTPKNYKAYYHLWYTIWFRIEQRIWKY